MERPLQLSFLAGKLTLVAALCGGLCEAFAESAVPSQPYQWRAAAIGGGAVSEQAQRSKVIR